ncbi:unnamed protein product [Amoebophrya sp. A120]|nr:unnamed protein product [Amoebophrya sp. A120]|eukprot:GSA120T00013775001.1
MLNSVISSGVNSLSAALTGQSSSTSSRQQRASVNSHFFESKQENQRNKEKFEEVASDEEQLQWEHEDEVEEFNNNHPDSKPIPFDYEREVSEDLRKQESAKILEKFPTRVPLICEKHPTNGKFLPTLKRKKFLVPEVMTLAQFSLLLKQQMDSEAQEEADAGGGRSSAIARSPAGGGSCQPDHQAAVQQPRRRRSVKNTALYFLLKNRQAPMLSHELKQLYGKNVSEDGFLYLHLCEEAVFGAGGGV